MTRLETPRLKLLSPGLAHSQSIRISDALTVPALSESFLGFSELPPVFATAFMIGFVEWTCIEALRDCLGPDQTTVGTLVDVTHESPTPVGLTVTAHVNLVKVDGRLLRFGVECRDDVDIIGRGIHERTIIDEASFAKRLTRKAAMVV